jgi:hypothetical protein
MPAHSCLSISGRGQNVAQIRRPAIAPRLANAYTHLLAGQGKGHIDRAIDSLGNPVAARA